MTDQPELKILLVGCEGKMGAAIRSQITSENSCVLVGQVDHSRREIPDSTAGIVVVDFSSDEGASHAAAIAYELQAPLLTGTTGLSQQTHEALEKLASDVPVGVVPNTSLGIAVLRTLIGVASEILSTDGFWTLEVEEKHHSKKIDAPSGTALDLIKVCSESGMTCAPAEITSVREGSTVGEHEIRFLSGQETLTLRHEAHDRMLFARGAVRLARVLREQPAGLYDAAGLLHPQNG